MEVKVSDIHDCRLGVPRCLSGPTTGQEFLQFHADQGHAEAHLSPKPYNARTGLAVMVPITGQVKGYPFEVAILTGSVHGAALGDHLRNPDWKARGIRLAGTVPPSTPDEIHGKVGVVPGICAILFRHVP